MAIAKKIHDYLKQRKMTSDVVPHRKVFTAYDLAATLKEKLARIGKTLLVKADGRHVLVLLPANRRLHFPRLKKALGAKKISIASEKEMSAKLKVKPGALTPFAALHKVELVADTAVKKASHLIVGAGSFTESLRLKVRDLLKHENATVANISESAELKDPGKQKPSRR